MATGASEEEHITLLRFGSDRLKQLGSGVLLLLFLSRYHRGDGRTRLGFVLNALFQGRRFCSDDEDEDDDASTPCSPVSALLPVAVVAVIVPRTREQGPGQRSRPGLVKLLTFLFLFLFVCLFYFDVFSCRSKIYFSIM